MLNKKTPSPRSWRRFVWPALAALACSLVLGELVARYGLGLGTPPLTVADSDLEYRLKPNQDVQRFGNRYQVNTFSMRSRDFPAAKTDPREFRILLLGDSVLNGGSLTDQSELASERLPALIAPSTTRPVLVANASAVSWGPPNLAVYIQKFGTFDADFVGVVLSSHDAGDQMRFKPLDPRSQPSHRPWSALSEGFATYFWPRVLALFSATNWPPPSATSETAPVSTTALPALADVIDLAAPARTVVFHFPTREEASARAYESVAGEIRRTVTESGGLYVPLMDPSDELADGLPEPADYRDAYHPSPSGQSWMARRMLPYLVDALSESNPAGRSEVD